MGGLTILEGLQPKVYDHECAASDRLVRKLKNPIYKKVFEQGGFGGEHRIVVFGQSGVGKTTLILKLLGAKTPSEDKKYNLVNLAHHIRGNTQAGGPGTPTVYRYRVSDTDDGLVQYKDGAKESFHTLKQMEKILHRIRERVKLMEWNSDQPVYITLPKSFFHKTEHVPWVITDLPGVDSRNQAEHAHVSDLIKAHVLHSNVLMVVEQSNQIGQLRYLRIPDLGPWNYFGRRCRLIVTRSMSEESIKQRFRSSGKLTRANLVSFYTENLKEEGIELDDISGVFPMDYGNSWAELEEGEKQLFDNVKDAMSEIHQELIESLNKSLRPEEEFLSIMDIEKLSQRIAKERSTGENRLRELKKKIHGQLSKRGKLEKREESTIAKIDKIQMRRSEIKDTISENTFINPWDRQPQHTHHYNQSHSDNHDREWRNMRDYYNRLVHDFSKQVFGDRERIHDFLQENYKSHYPIFSASWRDWCQGYSDWDGEYKERNPWKLWLWKIDAEGPRKSHRRAFRNGVRDIMGFWSPRVNKAVKKIFSEKRHKLNCQADCERKLIRVIEQQKRDIDTAVEKMKTEQSEINQRLEWLLESQKTDLAVFGEEYPRIRQEEYHKAFTRYFGLGMKEKNPTRALQYFAFCYQIDGLTQTLNQGA